MILLRLRTGIVFLLFLFAAAASRTQTPCENGLAGVYECENVNLLAHVTPAEIGGALTNEVWGWTDPLDGKEYVILGASTGVFFFDISNPIAPLNLGHLPKHTFNSLWRSMRTYQNYLFVCSEANGHGMQVFDLTRLRNIDNPPVVFDEDAHYNGFGNCHTLAIHEESGYAYACGTSTYAGGLHIVNIQDPLQPLIAGGYDLNGYTHEAGVWTYDGPDAAYAGKTIAICFNGSASQPLTIVDVTDPSDATTISLTPYPQQSYCHQGWFTQDKGYLLVNDELDEYNGLADSLHTHIFDVHDLDNPVYLGYHNGGTAIDHNLYIIGNIAFQSNYTDGFVMLDVTNVAETALERVAWFDHYPTGDPEIFQGEWMNYPYFESGVIPVTDIYNGMFLLQPDFVRVAAPTEVCVSDGFEITVELLPGFVGPFELEWLNLPGGFEVVTQVDSNDEFAVGFSLADLPDGNYTISFVVQGAHFGYTEQFMVSVQNPITWFADNDGDGYGTEAEVALDCLQPFGFAPINGDCNDQNEFIHPNAAGSQDNLDSNCNGVIDNAETQICADLNNDGWVDVNDLYILNGNYDCISQDCIADINQDGMVNTTDLIIFLLDFGEFCED
jgi:choice-of-anchor B domain-containing protein